MKCPKVDSCKYKEQCNHMDVAEYCSLLRDAGDDPPMFSDGIEHDTNSPPPSNIL